MIARDIPARTGADAVRVVRALGSHRYVRGRLHVVHALAFDAVAAAGPAPEEVAAACEWARATLADPDVEADSKDPRLFRDATDKELALVLETFWVPGPRAERAHERLLERAFDLGLDVPAHDPFDPSLEDEMHPVLVDAGWELHPLAELDPVRHRGVIEAYDEPILYAAARFEEENAIPPRAHLHELPALGLAELLRGVDADGDLVEPLVLWTEGDEVYQDYVTRGVLKVAKL
jgi:hypothetical protein